MNTLKRSFGFRMIKGLAEFSKLKRAVTRFISNLMRNFLLSNMKILMFLFLYRCNGMDLVTDKNRFAKSVSKPFLKRSASFGSYWEACQPTLHTGPTLPEYQWILSRIGPVSRREERAQLKRFVSPSLNLVSLLRQREIYFGIFRNTNDKKYLEEDQLS